ncbi:MAG: (E)-4-hydroxy-3-methylbut-2-enyl-diphosphate synthase [Bacteroidales bacterium]|nr:(E)-4-hydroxy-3-methylbut-2-enyl-diphosphate synthase [Bacteroidales bacterium]MBD5224043.1 (E)-4-hydroxy-3-methylbut-2-enyl-diphosphate synthase [Bacteroidales bacterium]
MFKYNYERRVSHPVKVGDIVIGGDNPIVIQSMTNTSTLDTEGSAAQALRIASAGGELVRLTTQGVREAANLAPIKEIIRGEGSALPLSADVHFNPKAAFEAARTADKVRINPGNFVDAARTFRSLEFTDEEYAAEIERIRASFVPFLKLCRENNTAVRLGVNHGSLSDRIMSRYGDTPAGMVESVMEFLRIAEEEKFKDIIISIKASNTVVMVETVRLLVKEMEKAGMDFPLHLGVTEAGDAEDGRIKSAVGIGALLHEGIGDTIRVSLSEPPENEIPVARLLRQHVGQRAAAPEVEEPKAPVSVSQREIADPSLEYRDFEIDNPAMIGQLAADIDKFVASGYKNPVRLIINYNCTDLDELRVRAGADFGALLLSGYGSDIKVKDPNFDEATLSRLASDILQAARLKFYKTEYIACPGCGRTLFDLQSALAEVKKEVGKLGIEGLKIGVMGCIVNGPGEMADADYGYVGAGPGRVSIYRGKQLITKNIPTAEALPALIELIKSDFKQSQA